MADTPRLLPPRDAEEQAVLERLLEIRNDLFLLKQDKSTYVKSSDVMALYEKTITQVRLLNDIRPVKPEKETQVERVLDNCFHLLSLFFMTIGRNNEAPAAYALTSTIKRLLDHMAEAVLYTSKDIDHITSTIESQREIVKKSEGSHSPKLIKLLSERLELCHNSCLDLRKNLDRLDPCLQSVHEKLISILRSISLANTKAKFNPSEVRKYQAQLRDIEAAKVDGNFVSVDGRVPPGNEEICELLMRCLAWSEIVLDRGKIPEEFKQTYEVLVDIRNKLEKKTLTQAWSLRETDLYDFQRQLDKIDESRVDGNFFDEAGSPAEVHVQRTFLYLIRRCYGYIYYLMVSSEPVSEGLLPIYNQLMTLRRCLLEVKESGGLSTPRELYPYSMKLNSIDNLRKDGKFIVGGDVPEGQGSVNELLAQCFDLQYELRIAVESEAEE